MQKKNEFYRGKVKTIYSTNSNDFFIIEFRNEISSADGRNIDILKNKGLLNNKFNYFIMNKLYEHGIPNHMEKLLSDTECLVKKLDMIPIEFVIRNYSAGSLAKRLGIKEGIKLKPPIFEIFLKNDSVHDPIINSSYCETFNWVNKKDLFYIKKITYKINNILENIFDNAGIILIDFKCEFGFFKKKILLGDEFSPDTSRLWDKKTLNKMDKDRFRYNLGDIIESYKEVASRIGVNLN